MTTDMQKTDYDTLKKIATIQEERRKNWTGGIPNSVDLEAAHQLELVALRNQLPGLRDQEPERTPSAPRRGWLHGAMGNIIKRFFFIPIA
jgi:hypothetical protein